MSMDTLLRDKIRGSVRVPLVAVDDYRSALRLESMIKGGRLSVGQPRLNPFRASTFALTSVDAKGLTTPGMRGSPLLGE
jgi:hypothetical protein